MAESHEVQFAVCVVAPEGSVKCVILGIMECGTTMCGADSRGCQQRGHTGIESSEGIELM
jgi:hypothetical protein